MELDNLPYQIVYVGLPSRLEACHSLHRSPSLLSRLILDFFSCLVLITVATCMVLSKALGVLYDFLLKNSKVKICSSRAVQNPINHNMVDRNFRD